jgi:TonB family protein
MNTTKVAIVLAGLGMLTVTGIAGASYDSAMKDYDAGRFDAAIAELQCLAAEGNPDAGFNLAAMYLRGEGTEPDPAMAFAWFSVAAAEGDAEAARMWLQIEPQLNGAQLIKAERVEAIARQPERQRLLRLAAFGRQLREAGNTQSGDTDCSGQFVEPDVAPSLDSPGGADVVVTRPNYPEKARAERRTGSVHMGVHLDRTGRVCQVTVIQSSGYDDLDMAAINAVRGWRWLPALREAQPVESITTTALGFYLEDVTCLERHKATRAGTR